MYSFFSKENSKEEVICHISFDDSFALLNSLLDRKYISIYQSHCFFMLYILHKIFGCRYTFYCFDQIKDFSKARIRIKKELRDCNSWITIEYHGEENGSNFMRFKNGFENIERVSQLLLEERNVFQRIIRLHKFAGNEQIIDFLNQEGIEVLLSADDTRISYELSKEDNALLLQQGEIIKEKMCFWKTDIRIEKKSWFSDLKKAVEKNKEHIVIFSHERLLMKWRYFYIWIRLLFILIYLRKKKKIIFI